MSIAHSVGEKRYRVVGRHVYGNLYGCRNKNILRDPDGLKELIRRAAEAGNMTLLDIKAWKIGEGVSIVGIVLGSHITIHTWPEYDFATVDVYSCGEHTDPEAAFEVIVRELRPVKVARGSADRSLE